MEDLPVVGEEPSPQCPVTAPPRAVPVVVAALAAAAALWLVGGQVDDRSVDLSTLPSPTTTLAPLVEVGRIVDQELEWSDTVGLEDVDRVGAMVTLEPGGPSLLLVLEGGEVAIYRSHDGVVWDRTITLADDVDRLDAQPVMEVVGGRVLVAVNPSVWPGVREDPWVWQSQDGVTWSGGPLPRLRPGSAAAVQAMAAEGDGVLLTGAVAGGPDLGGLAAGLPPEVLDLVERGGALVGIDETGELRVRVPPGLVIYSRLLDHPELAALAPPRQEAVAWRGPDRNALIPTPWREPVELRGALADGRLVGASAEAVVVSRDGLSWDEVEGILPYRFGVWEDGIVGITPDGLEVVGWDATTGEVGTLGSRGLFGGRTVRSVTASASGIAALVGGSYTLPSSQVVRVWREGDLEAVITSSMNLILRRKGESEESTPIVNAEASLEGELLRIDVDGTLLEVPVDEWRAAVDTLDLARGFQDLEVAHSRDTTAWGFRTWRDIAGAEATAATLFSTEDFLLAVDQGSGEDDGIAGTWVGRPGS